MGTLLDFKIETMKISFINTDTMTISFSSSYTTVPSVVATAVNKAASIDDNLNVFVENVTTTQATIRTSAIIEAADIDVQIIGS